MRCSMEIKADIVYNSENGSQKYQIASGYISETVILFKKEEIAIRVFAEGRVDFLDLDGNPLAVGKVEAQTGGREVYEELVCEADEKTLTLKFPIVKWIDNYPNCDGENDRWDSVIIGYNTLIFDRENKAIV